MVMDNGDLTATVTFQPGVALAVFTAGMLEIFDGATWVASTAVSLNGSNFIRRFDNAALNGSGGQLWRMTTPPPGIAPNQTGITTT